MNARLKQLSDREVRVFQACWDWTTERIKAHFPDTGGSRHLLHNWYICGEDKRKARLAQKLLDVCEARYDRIKARCARLHLRDEHKWHVQAYSFRPLWCEYCQREHN